VFVAVFITSVMAWLLLLGALEVVDLLTQPPID
jgi:hypothetical protein